MLLCYNVTAATMKLKKKIKKDLPENSLIIKKSCDEGDVWGKNHFYPEWEISNILRNKKEFCNFTENKTQ